MKLKKGDMITVTIGKDKGKTGKIERVMVKEHAILVPGIHVIKRHTKRRDEQNPGGIIDVVKPIAVSKVALVCPNCKKMTRVGYLVKGNDKLRICRKCEQKI